jgi:glycosyltransferase involved in cell wall biosynthesis
MRILIVHNRYQIAGGEDVAVLAEKALLESRGHEVALVEANNATIAGPLARCRTAINAVYSRAARRRVRDEIVRFHPHIAHVHNFFPLFSPSVYDACREEAVPVVQSLHNYRLICPNALCFRAGRPCEDCVGKFLAWPGVAHACYRHSRTGTATVAAMLTAHRLAGTWRDKVDVYIAPSEFSRALLIRGGLPSGKIAVKPNFLHPTPAVGKGNGGFALYVGRLSEEKGLSVLLAAWEKSRALLPLRLVGDGPLQGEVSAAAHRLPHVTYEGRLPRESVLELMQQAALLILPSICYEGAFPIAGLEAWAVGLPLIASNHGNLAHGIEHGRTGLLFAPGNAEVLDAQSHPAKLAHMRLEARHEYLTNYTADRNYDTLMDIYQRALKQT